MKKLTEFYSSMISDTHIEDEKVCFKIFVEDMILILDKKFEVINICIEIFLLLSYLTNQNEIFKTILDKSPNFVNILQKIINTYSVKLF